VIWRRENEKYSYETGKTWEGEIRTAGSGFEGARAFLADATVAE
jgi:hypothetical protein